MILPTRVFWVSEYWFQSLWKLWPVYSKQLVGQLEVNWTQKWEISCRFGIAFGSKAYPAVASEAPNCSLHWTIVVFWSANDSFVAPSDIRSHLWLFLQHFRRGVSSGVKTGHVVCIDVFWYILDNKPASSSKPFPVLNSVFRGSERLSGPPYHCKTFFFHAHIWFQWPQRSYSVRTTKSNYWKTRQNTQKHLKFRAFSSPQRKANLVSNTNRLKALVNTFHLSSTITHA